MPNNFRPLSCLWLALTSVFLIAGCSTSGTGSGTGGGSNTPVPALASISPTSTAAGTSSVSLTATGSNFTSASQIEIAGTPVVTNLVSSTQLTATVTSSLLANAGTIPVAVVTGGQITSSVTFTVNNPAPTVTNLAPLSVAAGSTAATITLTGTGFVSGSTGSVNGSARPTALLSSTQLQITLSATDLAAIGTVPVVVTNPSPGGGASTASNVTVVATASNSPTIRSVSPSSIYVGSTDTTLGLSGTNFNSACTIQVNGKTATVGYLSPTQMVSTAPTSLLTSTGSFPVTVSCLGITSNVITVSVVNPPVPTLTAALTAIPLNTQTTFSATGTGFTANTVLQLNGVSLPTTYKSTTSLTAVIPASAVTSFGNYNLTAYTPAPGGGTSTPIAATPYVSIANNSMVYNPADGLFYLSIPSSAGAPYGNSVVSVDPVSGALGTPIFVGSEPDRLAISSDGSVLWVGLDGGSSVRRVNLTTKTAGYSFNLGGNAGVYNSPPKVVALAALPGSPDSVVVAATSSGSFNNPLQIFDSGVPRASSFTTYIGYPTALQVDGTRNEVYAASGSGYYVFSYSSSGLTTKTSVSTASYASYYSDDLQNANGRLYTDVGKVYDTESGALLGTLYTSGTTAASGPAVADTTLNKIFVLDSSTQSIYDQNQIQIFDLNAYTTSSNAISVYTGGAVASHLTRWGANGLAFRTGTGFYSLRSNFVKDLSSTNADLGVAVSAPSTATTGSTVSYTVTATNLGPSSSTGISLSYATPSNGVVTAVTPSQGACNTTGACDLGSLSSSASAAVVISVQMLNSGTATLTTNISGSENDPTTTNNSASAAVTVTGSTYSLAPSITTISPAAIQTGLPTDTTITVNGTNFTAGSTVTLGASSLATTYVSPTQLTAVVPQATSASLGWGAISVSTPAPGGGSSNMVPLSFFQVLTAGINHMLYDPFSRKIMVAVGSGSSTLTGNSIVALTPETATFGNPVSVGSQPTNLALSSDGSLLYTVLTGSQSVARFNMLSQSVDFTFTPATPSTGGGDAPTLRDVAVEPRFPNTVVVDLGAWDGLQVYDLNPSSQTATARGANTGPYTGSNLQFLDSANMFAFDVDTSGSTFNHFTLTSSGFTYYNYSQYSESTLSNFGRFKIRGNLAFANNGGVADPTASPAKQVGVYAPTSTYGYNQIVEPDTSLSRVFFLGETSSNSSGNPDGIVTYNQQTFLPLAATPLNMQTIEGSSTSYSGVDLVRWGQDGLAVLTSGGHIYLLRGAAVVPALLTSNPTPTLSALSTNTIAVGTGNTTINITGSNFVPGAGVFWNGSYRTTTYVDSSHLTAYIPASDLATAGTAAIIVGNPDSYPSGILSITIQ